MPCFGKILFLLLYLQFIFWYHPLWFIFLSIRGLFPPLIFKILVSNVQIPRFNLIIYNSCNWAASSTLIYTYVIISTRDLNCSSVVRLYSCKYPTCCSFGALDIFTLGTYDGTDLGSPEGSTEVTTGGNLEGLLIGDWIGYIDGIELVTDVGNEINYLMRKCLSQHLDLWIGSHLVHMMVQY